MVKIPLKTCMAFIHEKCLFGFFFNFAGIFVAIYKSVTNYKNNSQMFEIIFHIQLSVSFLFSSNSGTTCCLHCSSETKVPVIFNESSLLKFKEILSLRKGQGLKYSTFELPAKIDKSHDYHLECYRRLTALSKAQREKLDIV